MMNDSLATKVDKLLNDFEAEAVIFDLDGTMLDNNPYHLQSWKKYLENMGRDMTEQEYNANINGRTNTDVIKYIHGDALNEEDSLKYGLQKETLYREVYKPFIKPVKGLLAFLKILADKKVPMAIATSGIQPNIDFMFDHVPIKQYFKIIVNSSHIKKGKPDPEIYIKAASLLSVSPKNCLVFEDAVVGINSAKAAGMKVIAIATTHPKEELNGADMIIDDFEFNENHLS